MTFDSGIASTVRWLQGHGFETTDSGDGHSKLADGSDPEALTRPHVHMRVEPGSMAAEADRLHALLAARGITLAESGATVDGPEVLASYDPANGVAVLSLLGVSDARLEGHG